MLIKPEESLLECLVMNADPKNDADYYEFDPKTVDVQELGLYMAGAKRMEGHTP